MKRKWGIRVKPSVFVVTTQPDTLGVATLNILVQRGNEPWMREVGNSGFAALGYLCAKLHITSNLTCRQQQVSWSDSGDLGAMPSSAEVENAIRSAVKHWSVEISFLRSLSRPTEEQIQRLRALQAFIVIVDPLRKYEIDHWERPLFVNQLFQDLNDKIRSSSGSKRDEFLAATHRSLSGKPIAQPGAMCNAGAARFLSLAKSRDEEPGEVLAALKQKMLIRIGHQDEVSISPLGTSLMERQLDTKRQEGTIGKAIRIESFALLERLRD